MEGGSNRDVSSQVTMSPGLASDQRRRYYRIIVGNNPVNRIDPYGLQEEESVGPLPQMPGKKPNVHCCDKLEIMKEINYQVVPWIRDLKGGKSYAGEGIVGAIMVGGMFDPETGWVYPSAGTPEFFDPYGCSMLDPCVRYCCRLHEWFHYTDTRPWNVNWDVDRLNRHTEIPAFKKELECLRSFL